nr:Pre-mRNA-processing factor like [Ipomoea batatas]
MRRHSEDDRCHVLSNGDYYLYGKRLFLKSHPERFRLGNSDFCTLPIWVQFPSLPIEFWHPVALSKIASCIGKPLWSDKMTKELKKGRFARVLIEIDTSTYPLEAVPVTTPNGTKHFALGDVPSDHLNPSSPLDPCVLEEMDTNMPCQPFPPLGDGDLDTTLDATTDPGLENEEFDKEGDKAPPKDLVPSKTYSPTEVFQEATGGKKKKNVLKKVGGVKFIGVKGLWQKKGYPFGIKVDFRKAYDTVDWDFLAKIWSDVSQWFDFLFQTRTICGSLRWIKKAHVRNQMHSKGISLALLCTIYHIWKIRNFVLREEDRLAPIAAVRIIVRDRLSDILSRCSAIGIGPCMSGCFPLWDVLLDASKFVRGASASSARWRGISFASAAPSPTPPASTSPETKKTRKRVSKDERRAMVQAFVNKYRTMNSGKFPTPSIAKNEVGGSYYLVRSIVQELEYECKMSSLKVKGDTLQEKDVSINDDLTGNIKELQKTHLPLNMESTGAQIKGTTFKDIEAVDVGEMTLLHGMESASMMCKKAEVDLKEEITTTEDKPKFDNLKLLAEQQHTRVDFEDSNIQHIEEELGQEMLVDKTTLNDIANASKFTARERNLLTVEAKHILDSGSKKAKVNLKQKIIAEDELKFDGLKPLANQQQQSGVNDLDSSIQHIEAELGPKISIAAEYAVRESHLLAIEARHLCDSHAQNAELNLNEVTSTGDRLKLDSTNPLDQQQQLTGTVPMGLGDCNVQCHEAELGPETLIPIEKTPLNDIRSASGYSSKYATGESHLQEMEANHVMDSHPEKLMDDLNEKISSSNELKFDGWKPLVEEQQPSEMRKLTRELPNEKKDGVKQKEQPSVWQNLKSFADGIISFWRKL